jgi:thiol-disulfide isomerase/thioredoxin
MRFRLDPTSPASPGCGRNVYGTSPASPGRARNLTILGLLSAAALPVLLPVLLAPDARAQEAAFDRPWLGISMGTDASSRGVAVDHVVRGSPADRAGLHEGDRILRVSATPVLRGADVVRIVASRPVGAVVDIAFIHRGAEVTAPVTLGAFPSPSDMMRMDLMGTFPPPWKGLKPVVGSVAPSVGALRGRVVVLDFWASWCGPCRFEMPTLSALQDRYGAQGLSVVGVAAEDAEDILAFSRRMPVTYALVADSQGETSRSYGVSSLPTLVVIDRQGVVRLVEVGYDPTGESRFEAAVRALLVEPPAR